MVLKPIASHWTRNALLLAVPVATIVGFGAGCAPLPAANENAADGAERQTASERTVWRIEQIADGNERSYRACREDECPQPTPKTLWIPTAIAEQATPTSVQTQTAASAVVEAPEPALKADTDFASYRGFIEFAPGSMRLGPLGRNAVNDLLPPAKMATMIALRGRTGTRKPSEEMRKLAIGRGVAVREALVERGIDRKKCSVFARSGGYGDQIAAGNPGGPSSRRVDVEMKLPDGRILKRGV